MGAWGYGPFENDDALDFVGDLQTATGTGHLSTVFSAIADDRSKYVEAPISSAAIAAAEVVAALLIIPAPGTISGSNNVPQVNEKSNQSCDSDRVSATMRLLGDDELERSAVVANCRMNRERNLLGSNGYDRELGLNPLDFVKQRIATGRLVAWLDLCCGTGRALIQAARQVRTEGLVSSIEIVGVDLVGMFDPNDSSLSCLRLVEASLTTWCPDRSFDLITCVHGLHYIGDKIGLIARAASWLVDDGLFVANLDLANIDAFEAKTKRKLLAQLRGSGLEYDRRKRRIVCEGAKRPALPFRYLGADDRAGPNYTGQPAVTSHYESSHLGYTIRPLHVDPDTPTIEEDAAPGCSR